MLKTWRREFFQRGFALAISTGALAVLLGCVPAQTKLPSEKAKPNANSETAGDSTVANANSHDKLDIGNTMQIQYLEIVTPDVEAACQLYSKLHGVTFDKPDPNLGGARTASLTGGGKIGIRAPMRETEKPVVRPYTLVQDIEAAVNIASQAGAVIALPPMEIPGHGTCAIYIQDGIEVGLWQL